MKKTKIRNTVPTFRVEILSYAGPGMNEEIRWNLLGVRNKEDQARELLDNPGFVRMFKCLSNGREFVDANFGSAEMFDLVNG